MRIKNRDVLVSHGNIEGRKLILELLEEGLSAADPYYNTSSLVRIENGKLYVGKEDFDPIGSPRVGVDEYDLEKDVDRIFIFGAGKGIWRAIQALEEKLGDYLTGGSVILKHGDEAFSKKIEITYSGHPVPDEHCIKGCKNILSTITNAKLTERDIVFTVIGNGVSSLLTLPPDGITLEEVQAITRIIQIERGFSTLELNRVRNQVDMLKGGRITRFLYPARMYHLVTIDVNIVNRYNQTGYQSLVETNTWLHTLPDMTQAEDAIRFLKEHDIWNSMSDGIKNYLTHGVKDNPVLTKNEFEKFNARIFGMMPKHLSVVPRIIARAKEFGLETHYMTNQLFIEATAVSNVVCKIAKNIHEEGQPFKAPCILLFAGELLVTVGKNGGIGGRNQEFCLAAAKAIAGNKRIVIGSADTDGTDGPGGEFNDEASNIGCRGLSGGVVDGYTVLEAEEMNVDIDEALKIHATSAALWKLNGGVWATQNISINDIILVLVMDHDGERK